MKNEPAKQNNLVGLSELHKRCGETHPRARLTDHDVDLIRELHEYHGLSYSVLAEKFDSSKSAIADICRYRRRANRPVRWKRAKGVDK